MAEWYLKLTFTLHAAAQKHSLHRSCISCLGLSYICACKQCRNHDLPHYYYLQVWRDGQRKRVYLYQLLKAGTVCLF